MKPNPRSHRIGITGSGRVPATDHSARQTGIPDGRTNGSELICERIPPPFGKPLSESDYATLDASWISREIADAAMLRRVDEYEAGEVIGQKRRRNCAGVLFPTTGQANRTLLTTACAAIILIGRWARMASRSRTRNTWDHQRAPIGFIFQQTSHENSFKT